MVRRSTPPGVQPEQGGRLECLECGRWFRQLAIHLRNGHGIDPEEYKQDHELPATRSLIPEELRERFAENTRRRLAEDESLRQALTNSPEELAMRLKVARQRKAETAGRVGVLRSQRDAALEASRIRSRQTKERNDAIARDFGYDDIVELLEATTHLSVGQVAQLFNMDVGNVTKLRSRYAIRSSSRTFAASERVAQRELLLSPPDVEFGTQPQDEAGRQQCLECSLWFPSLGRHIPLMHSLDAAAYRRKHGLSPSHVLMAPDLHRAASEATRKQALENPRTAEQRAATAAMFAEHREKAIAAARIASQRPEVLARTRENIARAAQIKSELATVRYDEKARALGYQDLSEMLVATAHLRQVDVAPLLGVSASQVGRLRTAAKKRSADAAIG